MSPVRAAERTREELMLSGLAGQGEGCSLEGGSVCRLPQHKKVTGGGCFDWRASQNREGASPPSSIAG